jgi:hypothetical protein
MPTEVEDFEYLEHRTWGDYDKGVDKQMIRSMEAEYHQRGWNPYEQDLTHYPELYKMYGENFERYEKAKRRFETEPMGEETAPGPLTKRMPRNLDPWTKKYDDFMPRFTGGSML